MAERAGLDELRAMIGQVSTKDDAVLSMCLEAAGTWVYDRISAQYVTKPEVVQAVLMLATRLYKRRQSPEGIVNWHELGGVKVIARDPDVERLLEQYLDAGKVWGIA